MAVGQVAGRAYSRRELFNPFLASLSGTQDVAVQGTSSANSRCRIDRHLLQHCSNNMDSVAANVLAGQQTPSDFDLAAQTSELLGSHFANLYLDRYNYRLLPQQNNINSIPHPAGYINRLRSYNSSVKPESLSPISLPVGENYTSAVNQLKAKGYSGTFYAVADVMKLMSQVTAASSAIQPAHLTPAVYHSRPHLNTVQYCGITKANVCKALTALTNALVSMTLPFALLCDAGALASTIAFVIATDGIGAVEAAALVAEGKEVCDSLSVGSVGALSAITDLLVTMAC